MTDFRFRLRRLVTWPLRRARLLLWGRAQRPLRVGGVWVRSEGLDMVTAVEVLAPGRVPRWVEVSRERVLSQHDTPAVSHIIEPAGVRQRVARQLGGKVTPWPSRATRITPAGG